MDPGRKTMPGLGLGSKFGQIFVQKQPRTYFWGKDLSEQPRILIYFLKIPQCNSLLTMYILEKQYNNIIV